MVQVAPGIEIPEEELAFTTSRSSGPGGQNVNKVNTRVTLLFDVAGSPSLTAELRARIQEKWPGYVDRRGVLRVSSGRFRTQKANKEAVIRRFVALVQEALAEPPTRLDTSVPESAEERRLAAKKHRSEVKQGRRPPAPED